MAYNRKIVGKFYLKSGVVVDDSVMTDGASVKTVIADYEATIQKGFTSTYNYPFKFGHTTFKINDISAVTFEDTYCV